MPSRTRRQILRAALSGVAGLSMGAAAVRLPSAQAQQAPGIGRQALSDTLHVLTVGANNVVVQTGGGAALLVDGASADTADALVQAVASLPASGPIGTLFNTHWHPEQIGLNERLGAAGATIIAQENTRLWLTTDITYPDGRHFEPLPEVAQPNQTFYDHGMLESGVQYGYLRHAAHTDGDAYVYFPDEQVLAVGDTITGQGAGWPFVDWWTGGWIGGMVGNLELLLSLTDEQSRIVPGRGSILSRGDLEMQFEMYNSLYESLHQLLNNGRSPAEAVAARPAAAFEAQFGPSDAFVEQAFKSLWAYLSPDA